MQPNTPQTVSEESVTLICFISGWGGKYNWYKDGVKSDTSAENYYTVKVDQSHRYKCYGSGLNGHSTQFSNEVIPSLKGTCLILHS